MRTLLGLAISPDHSYIEWAFSNFEIVEMRKADVTGCQRGYGWNSAAAITRPKRFRSWRVMLGGKSGFHRDLGYPLGPGDRNPGEKGARLLLCGQRRGEAGGCP
jgi:hypothetical protein